MEGRLVVFGGFEGTVERRCSWDGVLQEDWRVPCVPFSLRLTRKDAWLQSPGPRQLTEAERERVEWIRVLHPLLLVSEPRTPEATVERDGGELALPVLDRHGQQFELRLDPITFDVIAASRVLEYEEGLVPVGVWYGDYRDVDGLRLPFHMQVETPDRPHEIRVEAYQRGPQGRDEEEDWTPAGSGRPYGIELFTVPETVLVEPEGVLGDRWRRYWGVPMTPRDQGVIDLGVRERWGRAIEPVGLDVELRSGERTIKTVRWSDEALERVRRGPVSPFSSGAAAFHLRLCLAEPITLEIDGMWVRMAVRTPAGEHLVAEMSKRVQRYRGHVRLDFPLRGPFMVVTGHEPYEWSHVYERSQRFAYDIIGLTIGSAGEIRYEHEIGGRTVLAPAPGVVVEVRDDIPDGEPPSRYLRGPDPLRAVAGNGLTIDHGSGEFSCLFHLAHGSLRVSRGDRVERGQEVGRLGSSGTPGYPHLHYQLQNGPRIFEADGLPSVFENLFVIGQSDPDLPPPIPFRGAPLRGVPMRAS